MRNERDTSRFQIAVVLVLSSVVCLPAIASARLGASPATLGAQQDTGTMSGSFMNVPLGDVLGSLAEKASLVVRFIDPAAAEWPVFAEFSDLSLRNAIRTILKNVSYVYYEKPTGG